MNITGDNQEQTSFRIHYPLPLPYVGKPDPVQLQETIRKLREENQQLKEQVNNCAAALNYCHLVGYPVTSVLARRASRCPMDNHFWGKYIQKIHLIF